MHWEYFCHSIICIIERDQMCTLCGATTKCNGHLAVFTFCYSPPTKLRKGNVFSHVCLSVYKGDPHVTPTWTCSNFINWDLDPPQPSRPFTEPLLWPSVKRTIGLRLKGLLVTTINWGSFVLTLGRQKAATCAQCSKQDIFPLSLTPATNHWSRRRKHKLRLRKLCRFRKSCLLNSL